MNIKDKPVMVDIRNRWAPLGVNIMLIKTEGPALTFYITVPKTARKSDGTVVDGQTIAKEFTKDVKTTTFDIGTGNTTVNVKVCIH